LRYGQDAILPTFKRVCSTPTLDGVDVNLDVEEKEEDGVQFPNMFSYSPIRFFSG